jgi:hypothetical protein
MGVLTAHCARVEDVVEGRIFDELVEDNIQQFA